MIYMINAVFLAHIIEHLEQRSPLCKTKHNQS